MLISQHSVGRWTLMTAEVFLASRSWSFVSLKNLQKDESIVFIQQITRLMTTKIELVCVGIISL